MRLAILFAISINCFCFLFGQEEVEKYTIGKVEVKGNQYTDSKALLVIAGLAEGSTLVLPDDVQNAMKNLWDLNLFSDIRIINEGIEGETINLQLQVLEKPKISSIEINGLKSLDEENIEEEINPFLHVGSIITELAKQRALNTIERYFEEKGYLRPDIDMQETVDTTRRRAAIKLKIDVDRGERVKIKDVIFVGNEDVPSKKLRKQMKNTKPKRRFLASSKFQKGLYEEDQQGVINYYRTLGYRNMKILGDSTWFNEDEELMLKIRVSEGDPFFYRNITWKGNTLYSDEVLSKVLDLDKGDIYNQELLMTRLTFSMEGNDVSALYQDDGYLFFSAEPAELAIIGDSVDIEIRLYEGPQANVDRVVIRGNDRTHEHVVRREVTTRPGKKFSRSDIIRSQRKVVGLGYFDQENLDIQTPVNPQRGTVDIEYGVTERSSDQLELSAGYQPSNQFNRGGLIGTFGLQFNNFSLRNIFNTKAWHPLPQGDGQKLSLRVQTQGQFFQSYNFSFTEPWLGGNKPNSLTVAAFTSRQASIINPDQNLRISQITTGIGKQLQWPDPNFVLNNSLNFQFITLNDFGTGIFQADDGTPIANGSYNNFYLSTTLARNTVYDPLFPKEGSLISLTVQITPPFSLLNDRDYSNDNLQEKYRWIEYHKYNFKAEWYMQLFGKFVLKTATKMGIVSTFSERYGDSPFERFLFGAEPLQNQNTILGLDPITLRGYEEQHFREIVNSRTGPRGASVFNKYTFELRYPLSLNPSSTIYAHTFFEAGNAWNDLNSFNPFDVRRSVGAGLRVFLPMFGLLGFDYSIGFDKPDLVRQGAGISDFGLFTIILGFEPE